MTSVKISLQVNPGIAENILFTLHTHVNHLKDPYSMINDAALVGEIYGKRRQTLFQRNASIQY